MSAQDKRIWILIGGIVGIFLLFIPVSASFFGVNYNHTLRVVALGGAILGLVSGVLGSFAVLRQESLLGDALSHAALPGVALAFLVSGRELGALLIGAGVASWLAVQVIQWITNTTRIKQDAAMGIVLASFFAIGIALLTYIQGRPDASQAGLDKFIFGQAAAIVQHDVELISLVGLGAFVVLMLFWKEFKLIAFDMEFATANGFPARGLSLLLSTLIVVAIVLGLQLAGVILMVGLLIAPAVAARQWTNHLGQMVVLSAVFGGFAGATGAIISAIDVNLPTGPLIIVVVSAIVFLSISFAPGRGLVWTWIRQQGDRRRFAAQFVMRDIYKHALEHSNPHYPAPEGMLVTLRGGPARVGLKQLEQQGLVAPASKGGWSLTEAGIKVATQDDRNQHLWFLYRRYSDELDLPIISEDAQRDIREVLPVDAIQRLETLMSTGHS